MRSFQELFTRETSVDKCITLLTESLPLNVLELQPAFLFQKWQFSQIISGANILKFFKIAVLHVFFISNTYKQRHTEIDKKSSKC